MLPHGYPFRFVEGTGPGAVAHVLVTRNGATLRGGDALPPFLLVEMMAQAALLVLPQSSGDDAPSAASGTHRPRAGVLAGVEAVRFEEPVRAGDRLQATATLRGRLGGVIKAAVELRRGEQVVAAGDLLLALA